jgi:serine/threonine protein kinase
MINNINDDDYAFFEEAGLKFIKVIGKGGYGIIFLVHSDKYGQDFAVKRILASKFNKGEVDCIIKVDSPNVVNLYKYYNSNYYYKESVYLLMEYCPDSLNRIIKEKQLEGPELKKYALGVIKSVKACHDNNVSHSDIKPSNFLVDKYGRVKICDFGLSASREDKGESSLFAGSAPFMAPEVLKMIPYDPMKADIWSVGITLYYLAAGRSPWRDSSKETILEQIHQGQISTRTIKDKEIIHIIAMCLNPLPEHRPTIDQLANLPYFGLDAEKKNKPKLKIATTRSTLFLRRVAPIITPNIRPQKSLKQVFNSA